MFPGILSRVKKIIGIHNFNSDKDEILNIFIDNFVQLINLYVGTDDLQNELEFVVVECTVARYLRIGSEGLESESIGDISITYQGILEPYIPYLDTFKSTNKKVKFM